MPKVTFLPTGLTVEVPSGETLLAVASEHGLEIEHACGGNGACGTCMVYVKKGMDRLSPADDAEIETMDQLCPFQTLESRLACQAKVLSDVTVEIPKR